MIERELIWFWNTLWVPFWGPNVGIGLAWLIGLVALCAGFVAIVDRR